MSSGPSNIIGDTKLSLVFVLIAISLLLISVSFCGFCGILQENKYLLAIVSTSYKRNICKILKLLIRIAFAIWVNLFGIGNSGRSSCQPAFQSAGILPSGTHYDLRPECTFNRVHRQDSRAVQMLRCGRLEQLEGSFSSRSGVVLRHSGIHHLS